MPVRPNKVRARAVIVFLSITMLLYVAGIYILWQQQEISLSFYNSGNAPNSWSPVHLYRISFAVGVLSILNTIGTVIAFIMWFYRAYCNLHQKTNGVRFSAGWAAGSWFVPVLNLFRPVQIMWELSQKTYGILEGEQLVERGNSLKGLIPLWWIFLLSVNVIANTLNVNFVLNASHVVELIVALKRGIVIKVLSIVTAFITILLVYRYSRMEDLLQETSGNNPEPPFISEDDHELLDTI